VVEFAVKHMVVATARGRLAALGGELVVDAYDPLDSCVRVDLDATSLDTGSAERDQLCVAPTFSTSTGFP
jgi:polyisoprenoid-binding protein YceI